MKKLFVAIMLLAFGGSLFAQCPYRYGATEEDSLKGLEQVSIFNMSYKAKNYKDAYEAWQYIVNNCPCAWDGIYTNAQNLLQNLIKEEKDSLRREHLIDTLIYSYEVRSNYFPDKFTKGYGLGFKAYNTLVYRGKSSTSDELMQILDWFIQSVEMEKEKTQPAIWDKYFQLAEIVTKAKKDTTYVIDAYGRATDYLDVSINNALVQYEKQVVKLDELKVQMGADSANIVNHPEGKKMIADTARQMKLVDNYRKTLAKIEKAVTPYATCEMLEEVYSKKLATSKDDISAINKMVMTMSKGGCLGSPVFKEALEVLHKANPNRNSAYWMGNLSLKSFVTTKDNAELDAAINYLQEAVRLSETNEQKADANYMLALAYQTKSAYSEARNAAYAALKAQPNMGKAYLLIGDLYATSGGRCSGEDLPLACSWAAADKYAKAVAVDPSCANEAAAKRAKLRYPSKDELFKRGLKSGDPIRVGCWIQESTTVR
ncbi:MAG: tetratricopeptide repeat protein [Bacteroidales bacterium]|nr:tetratricopeptide repeat protein [Bacteroidales bacterium]